MNGWVIGVECFPYSVRPFTRNWNFFLPKAAEEKKQFAMRMFCVTVALSRLRFLCLMGNSYELLEVDSVSFQRFINLFDFCVNFLHNFLAFFNLSPLRS